MANVLTLMASWDTHTISIYVLMILLSTLFANLYTANYLGIRKIWIFLSFFVIWIVIGFSTCGADYPAYMAIFEKSNSLKYWQSTRIEKGYLLFNLFIRLFTNNYMLFHAIWAFVFLGVLYTAILRWKQIDVGMAIFCFSSIYCLQSMSLMRMYLAMAVTVWGYQYFIQDQKRKYFLCIIISMSFHLSAICLFLPLLFSYLLRSKKTVWFKIVVSFGTILAFYFFRNVLFNSSLITIHYAVKNTVNFGFAAIIYHIPIVILLVFMYRDKNYNIENQETNRLVLLFMLCSLIFGMAGYMVEVLGRIHIYFAPIYIIFPAMVFSDNKGKIRIVDGHCYFGKIHALRLMTLIFFIFRAFMISEYFFSDRIMPYTGLIIH